MKPIVMNRRTFLKGTGSGIVGLSIGTSLLNVANATAADSATNPLNTWLNILSDNTVNITVVKADIGQGIGTSLSSIIAEELDADWKLVSINYKGEAPPYLEPGSRNPPFTFGSTSVRNSYNYMRLLGATAKAMLKQACAELWDVDENKLITYKSKIYHPFSRRIITFGELAEAAAQLPVPEDPPFSTSFFTRYVGRSVPHKDTVERVEGRLQYAIDVVVPDMLYGAVKKSRVLNGEVANFAELETLMPPGQTLVAVPNGVVVTGKSWWEAQKTLDGLPIKFNTAPENASLDSAKVSKTLLEALEQDGIDMLTKGDPQTAFEAADVKVEAVYEVPYLAHSPMEPLTCTASVTDEDCEIWVGTQFALSVIGSVAGAINLPPSSIKVNTLPSGGSFGRRVDTDYVVQAVLASKAVGKPINLIWKRDEDTKLDNLRPAMTAKMQAGLNGGELTAWLGKSSGQSIFAFRGNPQPIDPFAAEGFSNLFYDVDNQSARYSEVDLPVSVGFWRSIGLSHNTFFVESFIDEIAHASGYDAYLARRHLARNHPDQIRVMDKLARISRWKRPSTPGASHGMAIMEGFGSTVGMVAEVTVDEGKVKVHNIWCVVDCGKVIHRDNAKAQIEGAIVFGLSAALFGEITLKDGAVEQSYFWDYPIAALKDMPNLHIKFLKSKKPPMGLGEAGVPAVAPAVANAVFEATGQRVRKLPFSKHVF